MRKLTVCLENCYGIKKLEKEFEFTNSNVIAIYAPNGVMKTSFLKTLADIENPKEEIYGREAICSIKDENGTSILQDNIFTVKSLDESYTIKNESKLLVNKELREEYDIIYSDVEAKKNNLLEQLKSLAGFTKRDVTIIERQILSDFSGGGTFIELLADLSQNLEQYLESPLVDLAYTNIFNQDTEKILRENDFIVALDSYMGIYNNLLEQSNLFKPGFDHYNANIVTKALGNDGWFLAGHKVKIAGSSVEIGSKEELEAIINAEKERFVNNDELRRSFKVIDDIITTKAARIFRTYINEHNEILPELSDCALFKKKLWLAYMAKNKRACDELLETHNQSQECLKTIIQAAHSETQKWENVVSIFHDRFFVPFSVSITNETDAVLGLSAPHRQITFNDGTSKIQTDEDTLRRILSQGEKRAKYLLDIIFDIETLKLSDETKLLVFDDIADSFDYKNKYAIIEYLKDLADFRDKFNIIILTHNFDFYRSVTNRLGIPRTNRLLAEKSDDVIELAQEKYQKRSPFQTWKQCKNAKDAIVLIPFVRNLIEFTKDENDGDYILLTSLLHQKQNTSSISMRQLQNIINRHIQIPTNGGGIFFPDEKVETRIYNLAQVILEDTQTKMELEDKVILSMAIRLRIEKFIIDEINDAAFVQSITSNQTQKLSARFNQVFPNKAKAKSVISKVNLMTPENIHINSFMYEPILDMSNEYLKDLYAQVIQLATSGERNDICRE